MLSKNNQPWTGAVNHLINDASQRVKKIQEKQEEFEQSLQVGPPKPIEKSSKLIVAKFQSEFSRVCRDLFSDNGDLLTQERYTQVMKELGFTFNLRQSGEALLEKVWHILSVNGENVKRQSLFNFLCYMQALPMNTSQ